MSEPFNDWAILELMGHRRLGGKVQDVEMFGARMCRIDIPKDDGTTFATQFYGAPSVYCLTPCTEETARAVAKLSQPAPVQRWELPPVPQPRDMGVIAAGDDGQVDGDQDPAF